MQTHENVISVENLSKSYGSLRAVDGISFDVQHGEIFGIIGPNGAGKTTTVEMISGLRQPDSGKARVLGLDPQRQVAELRQRTGVQLQNAALPDEMKVWEALDLFAGFYHHARDWHLLLEQWGLEEKRDAYFSTLSGGQKQRLFIALALVNDPELVFLDELTTGLDPQARLATWDMVRDIRRQGKTVVLVTHFMDEAEQLCDRVAIIDQGKLVALDTPHCLVQELDAGMRLRFTVPDGFDPACLAGLPGITKAVREGDEVSVSGKNLPGRPSMLLGVAGALSDQGITPGDLRTEMATLEDVFLARTGRAMRD